MKTINQRRISKLTSVILLITFTSLLLLPACNMIASDNPFDSLANGASLPAEYAIASGNPKLMYECLQERRNLLNSGDLSDRQRAEVALDMIDLLAVLSQIVVLLIPYLIDGVPPDDLDTPEEFLGSESVVTLSEIGAEDLMAYTHQFEISPLQLLWAVLGFLAYLTYNDPNGPPLEPADISPEDYQKMMAWAQYLEDAGVEIDNEYFPGVVSSLNSTLTDLDPN